MVVGKVNAKLRGLRLAQVSSGQGIRNCKRKVKFENGTRFGHFYIWDQFRAYSANVEALQHAAARLAENGA